MAMQSYIEQLKADTAAANQRREEALAKPKCSDPRIQCDKPLTDQISELMRSLPTALRDRPWSMDDLVARLNGRYNSKPSQGDVGQALKALSWSQRRDWTRDGGGRRYWFAPA